MIRIGSVPFPRPKPTAATLLAALAATGDADRADRLARLLMGRVA